MPKRIKVLVADDHAVVRAGLRLLLSADPALRIAGEAETGRSAVRLARKLHPDVVLLDLAMPDTNGVQASGEIRRRFPNAKVLVLSAYQDDETIQRAIEAGACGYLTKHSAAKELLTAIHRVSEGKCYFSAEIGGLLKGQKKRARRNGGWWSGAEMLTQREREVLGLIAGGHPNKEIAFTLHLSVKTVEKHRQSAMNKLDLHEIAGLTRYAVAHGLLGPGVFANPLQ
jgi:DNA-binding NarL/FixJ family response regulator